jgi:hypothetical protein
MLQAECSSTLSYREQTVIFIPVVSKDLFCNKGQGEPTRGRAMVYGLKGAINNNIFAACYDIHICNNRSCCGNSMVTPNWILKY